MVDINRNLKLNDATYNRLKKMMKNSNVRSIGDFTIKKGYYETLPGRSPRQVPVAFRIYAVVCRDENGKNLGVAVPKSNRPIDIYAQFKDPITGEIGQYVIIPVYPGHKDAYGKNVYTDSNDPNFLQSTPGFKDKFDCSHDNPDGYEDVILTALARYGSRGGIYEEGENFFKAVEKPTFFDGMAYSTGPASAGSPTSPFIYKQWSSQCIESFNKQNQVTGNEQYAPLLTAEQISSLANNPEQ